MSFLFSETLMRVKKTALPITKNMVITTAYPSRVIMVKGAGVGGIVAGTGQLSSQSTQLHAGYTDYLFGKIIRTKK